MKNIADMCSLCRRETETIINHPDGDINPKYSRVYRWQQRKKKVANRVSL